MRKFVLAAAAAVALLLVGAGCKSGPPAPKTYTCSMDGGSFDAPGKCPKCRMDLVEKGAEKKDS